MEDLPLRSLRDEAGHVAFAALHVPIYALLLAVLFGDGGASSAVIAGMDAFFGIHVVFRNHPDIRFGSAFSWSLIAGPTGWSTSCSWPGSR